MYVSMFEGMYVLPCSDDVQSNYGEVPVHVSKSEEYPITLYVCILYVSILEGMYVLVTLCG